MQIFMNVPVLGQSGYEVIGRGIALELDKLGANVSIENKDMWNIERCFLPSEDLHRITKMLNNKPIAKSYHILQQYPDKKYLSSQFSVNAIKSFCYSLFETDKCPAPWIVPLNRITETWTIHMIVTGKLL